ncbi:MAG: nucleotidyl transferase AbiEii/AbiGii toxin family protein [Myxococcota bacterium]
MAALTDPLIEVASRVTRLPSKDRWVLRGGLVMRAWLSPDPRPVDDVDFLVRAKTFDEVRALVVEAFPESFPDAFEETWSETDFPALRGTLVTGDTVVQVDVGWGDPLPVPNESLTLAGSSFEVPAREVMFAWKVHGLFERGPGRWRPKDLLDVARMMRRCDLQTEVLSTTLVTAFQSRGDDFTVCQRLFDGEFGRSRGSRRRWKKFRSARPDAPDDHLALLDAVAAFLRPLMNRSRMSGP